MSHNTLLYIYGKRARNFWGAILILFHFSLLMTQRYGPRWLSIIYPAGGIIVKYRVAL